MFLLGLSGGRHMANSEVLLRAALMGAKEVDDDLDVELIRLWDLKIEKPLGENARGKKQTDHAGFLNKKIKAADAIILSCPSYALTPPGYTINIRDRVSIRGLPSKFRPAGMIAIGGSDWTSLMLPLMYTILPHGECKIVDQMLVNFVAPPAAVLMNDKTVARAKKLGRNVAEAMQRTIEQADYVSEEPWVCPICHQNLLLIRGNQVECAICDVRGSISMKGGILKVEFTKESMQTYRWGPEGTKRHNKVIMEQMEPFKKNLPEIKRRLKEYESFLKVTKPPTKEAADIMAGMREPALDKTLLDV